MNPDGSIEMNCFVIFCLTIALLGKGVHAVNQIFDIDGTKNGSSGVITSPGYPGNYPNNVNYTWILRTGHPKATVNISIIKLDIRKQTFQHCGDYLQIYETEPCCFQAAKRCDSYGSFGLSVRGEKIIISFVSDELHNAKGFYLTWKVLLSDIITTTKSTLMTTNRTTSTTSTTGKITMPTRSTPDITITKAWKITSKTPPEKTVIPTSTSKTKTISRKTPTKPTTIMAKTLRTTRTTTSTATPKTTTLTTTLSTTELTKSLPTTVTTTLKTTSMWMSNHQSSSQHELLIYDLQETTTSSLITTKTTPSIILTATYTTNQTTSPTTTQRKTSNRLRLTTRTTLKRAMIPMPTAKPKILNTTPITSVKIPTTPRRTTTTKTIMERSETRGSKHSTSSMSSQHHSSIFDKSSTKSKSIKVHLAEVSTVFEQTH